MNPRERIAIIRRALEEGYTRFRFTGPNDVNTCETCREMLGDVREWYGDLQSARNADNKLLCEYGNHQGCKHWWEGV